jgi:hypothetical protein
MFPQNKDFKLFMIIAVTGCALFIGFFIYSSNANFTDNLSYGFKGVVENVSYDIKGIPVITVNKKRYCLSAGYNFRFQIEKGDELSKTKGSSIYILQKKKNGQVILFNN